MEYRATGELVAAHRHRDWRTPRGQDIYIILVYLRHNATTPWVVGNSYGSGDKNWSSGTYCRTAKEAWKVFQDKIEKNGAKIIEEES